MADCKHVWNRGTAGLDDTLAVDRALLIIKRSRAVEPNQVRGCGRWRHFIPHRARLGLHKRAPLYFAVRNIDQTAVADGAPAPAGWRLILYSMGDYTTGRGHRDCDSQLGSGPINQRH